METSLGVRRTEVNYQGPGKLKGLLFLCQSAFEGHWAGSQQKKDPEVTPQPRSSKTAREAGRDEQRLLLRRELQISRLGDQ